MEVDVELHAEDCPSLLSSYMLVTY